MLTGIDLTRKMAKADYKTAMEQLEVRLPALQRKALEARVPVIIVFEGWDAAGKGTMMNNLILPLDPRGFSVRSMLPPNEEEQLHPFLWRFWAHTPARGRITLFDRSWYRRVSNDRVDKSLTEAEVNQSMSDICSFERQLAQDGNVIVKFFLHISRDEQKKRFAKLAANPSTAWRVNKDDLKRHKQYNQYLRATEAMLARTDTDFAPWVIVEAHNERFATVKIFTTVIAALEEGIAKALERKANVKATSPSPNGADALRSSVLDTIVLNKSCEREQYRSKLKKRQKRLRELEHQIYMRRIPVVLVHEGWDAAGKGGTIKRLTQRLDPRGYEVVPVAAPNDIEKAHHYLWRFWTQMPKAGHIAIFDRSWYGRVLVERVEGFCTEAQWRRAYREINEMEQHLVNFGAIVLKFWSHIDKDEQLRRFKDRQQKPHKQWKITDEDWRNREKWGEYRAAVDEMIYRTSTPRAPWTIVESNCKWYARIKVLDTVIAAIEKRL
ncbi:MAG: polyphosphate:AMP phosphotransferase [Chitinivibrionales bacterium]|nr:polyphosphate:AMP phosphotransferase [Chitinivibrionales bacterium]